MVKVIIATHKEFQFPRDKGFVPVWLGSASDKGIYVSDRPSNPVWERQHNYAEVSALYYCANNLSNCITGLMHYRRYFAFSSVRNHFISENDFKVLVKSYTLPEDILRFIESDGIVRPKRVNYYHSMHRTLCGVIQLDDLKILYDAFKTLYPEDFDGFMAYMHFNNKTSCCNMLLCKSRLIKEYINWVDPIFQLMSKSIKLSEYSVPSRLYGFLSEVLMDYFFERSGKVIRHIPTVTGRDDVSPQTSLYGIVKWYRNELSFLLNRTRKVSW